MIGREFLSQVKNFDYVVIGTFYKGSNGGQMLIIKNIYKGAIKQDTIKLVSGGMDCFLSFDIDSGTQLVLGLVNSPYKSSLHGYVAAGCVTSALIISNENRINAIDILISFVNKPKINVWSRSMKLEIFENKIRRKTKYRLG
ncbi:hypothetical protein GXP67_14600 [Rhodocytophaga rosea]|uniref:Uncharacterized protein n=1 Tax=Rhodocytophaga rosea TaxID=2704465 RepID=A0A6C0GIK5_9BACT|nr:hypothetical protein [Rhodocytophaga rosea]QHT67777.1 hypothetical protein GXP67_14600 [Rhodocytophaga rosea]